MRVAKRIFSVLEKPEILFTHIPDRPGHDYRYSMDLSTAEKLGWERPPLGRRGRSTKDCGTVSNEPRLVAEDWDRSILRELHSELIRGAFGEVVAAGLADL